MERRHFLKLTFGFMAGAAALAASANAAPLPPISAAQAPLPSQREGVESAVISQDEVDHLKPEQVRWDRHWHRHWRHRHRGWHHRRWHRHRW